MKQNGTEADVVSFCASRVLRRPPMRLTWGLAALQHHEHKCSLAQPPGMLDVPQGRTWASQPLTSRESLERKRSTISENLLFFVIQRES